MLTLCDLLFPLGEGHLSHIRGTIFFSAVLSARNDPSDGRLSGYLRL